MTKNKIILISLAVLLVALVVVYFVVIAPLMDSEIEVPEIEAGEGLYNNTLTIYEPLTESEIVSISVKNAKDNYTFKTVSEGSGKYSSVIQGYEKLQYDQTYYTALKSIVMAPVSVGSQVFRNCSEEERKEYGVTPDTCQATIEVKYKDADGSVKTYVLRLGYEAYTANSTYYVSIDGRNHVYRFSGIANIFTDLSLLDFVSPIIYSGYQDFATAIMDIKTFSIYKGTRNDFTPYIAVTNKVYKDIVVGDDGEDEVYYSANLTFFLMKDGKIFKSTAADYEYSINAIGLFYSNFTGDKCIAINPDKALLDEYGLGDDDIVYIVNSQRQDIPDGGTDDNFTLPLYVISQPIYDAEEKANFYYTLTYQGEIQILVRIPESGFIPSNQYRDEKAVVFDETKLINWAATNSLGAGLKEALDADAGSKYSGIKSLTIKVPTSVYEFGEETFYVNFEYDEELKANIIKITTKSGRYTDKGPERFKPFNQFYYTAISHPIVSRFNTLEADVIAEIVAKPENNIYTVEAELNLAEGETVSKVQKFEYFKINSSTVTSTEYVMVRVSEGYYDSNGNYVITPGTEKIVFDTTKSQITDYIYRDFVALMEGKLEIER
ncbi:MAG: DUF4340 domain-containing protein [Clostridia bacterium]|nr:DUF4340 domain-containing protein [Clostridia bacterium]